MEREVFERRLDKDWLLYKELLEIKELLKRLVELAEEVNDVKD
jgi:hypothetical protein